MLNAMLINTNAKSLEKFIYVLNCQEQATKNGVNLNLGVIPNQKATLEFQFKNIVNFRGKDHLVQERSRCTSPIQRLQDLDRQYIPNKSDSSDSSDSSISKNSMILKWPHTHVNDYELELILHRMFLQRNDDETVQILFIPIKKVGFLIEPLPEDQGLFAEDQLGLSETQVSYNMFGISRGWVVIKSKLG
jgi:hypothetical protein